MIPSAPPRRRASERGEISWVTLVLILILVTAGYLAVVWVPVFIVRYEAGVIAGEFAHKAVHNPDDERLVSELCDRLAKLDQVQAPQPDGTVAVVPAVSVRPEDVTWERHADATPRTLRIAFEYTTSIHYPILDRYAERTFAVELEQDISPVKW